MRTVTKRAADRRMKQRHAKPPTTAQEAGNAWDNFRHKKGTRNICLAEQFGMCAYSEIVLDDNDLGMHLDHVEPKSRHPARTFDHTNLLLSAIDSGRLAGMARQDVFGGHARGNRYSKARFVNPLWSDSRRSFHYGSDGLVHPTSGLSVLDSRKALYTIGALNLNAPLLVNRRRRWLEALEHVIDTLLGAPDALEHFAQIELCETNGRLRPFHSAVRQRFGPLGERVVQIYCAHCE